MIGAPVATLARAHRAMDLLDVLGHARRVGGALQEGRPDVGPLDAPLDVRDEVLGHRVDVAVGEVVGQVVVAVDAGAGDDPHAGLIGHALHEATRSRPPNIAVGSTIV